MGFPILYPVRNLRRFFTGQDTRTTLIVEDVVPLVDGANNLNDRVEVLENAGAGSTLVASLTNVNLKTVATNTLNWESGKSAANTCNARICINVVSGAFVDNTTDIGLKLDTTDFGGLLSITSQLTNLISGFQYSASLSGLTYFPVSGDWSFPVTAGTLNDFVVNIYIFADTIPS